ncbi:hypothetical protein [Priestia megaterium]|uniref:hypothetical protein n=1 Tax=Priestia megaterium TaxID=1404 RepID=UPI000BFC506C|nr:hypothetical protein [Priestia megaterium]PGQ88360.1 hypothetical protein COA18_05365 [Priestia megaterium]
MEGLAKVAWTNRRIDKAGEDFFDLLAASKEKGTMSDDEISSILKHVKEDLNVDIHTHLHDKLINTEDDFFAPADNIGPYREHLLNKDPSDLTESDKAFIGFNGEKDGVASFSNNRMVMTHELGHGIDRKNNPGLMNLSSYSSAANELFPSEGKKLSALGASAGYALGDDEHRLSTGAIAGGAVGATLGVLPTIAANEATKRNERAANRYGEDLLRAVHDHDTAEKLIQQDKPLRAAAYKTYQMDALRNLRRSLTGAGIGTALGVGVGYLGDKGLDVLFNDQGSKK